MNAITGKIGGLQKAAFWLASFSAVSLLLGFVRDRILAHYFGAGLELDMYYAAFEIPDILFATAASIASTSILLPMFFERESDREKLQNFINSVFSYFSIFLISSCAVVFIFMPELVKVFFRSFNQDSALTVIHFSRILLLSPLFLGLSNFFGSIIQYEKRFLLYSLSPLFYNMGIIMGLWMGAATFGVIAAVYGVALGAFLHLLVQATFVLTSKERPRFSRKIFSSASWNEIKKVFFLSVPRTISLSVGSLVGLFFVSLASGLKEGSIAVFTLAFNLQSVLLSLIGGSYSLATFPALAEHFAKKEMESLIKCLSQGLRYIIFWSLPTAALFIVLRAHIVRVVLGSGAFDWSDTRMTAAVLALFVASVVFQSIQLFLTRAHYAFGKTRLPLIMNLTGAVSTILLAYFILHNFNQFNFIFSYLNSVLKVESLGRTAVLALPLSFSLGAILSSSLLWLSLPKEVSKEIGKAILRTWIDALVASLTLALSTLLALRVLSRFFVLDTALNVFLHGLLSGIVGIFFAILALLLLKNKELKGLLTGTILNH